MTKNEKDNDNQKVCDQIYFSPADNLLLIYPLYKFKFFSISRYGLVIHLSRSVCLSVQTASIFWLMCKNVQK